MYKKMIESIYEYVDMGYDYAKISKILGCSEHVVRYHKFKRDGIDVCEYCGEPILKIYATKRFCSEKCAKGFASKDSKNNTKIVYCIDCGKESVVSHYVSGKKYKCDDCKNTCKYCGAKKGECKHPEICGKPHRIGTLIKYFGLKKSILCTEHFYIMVFKIKEKLHKEYFDDLMSTSQMGEKYLTSFQTVGNIMKGFGFKLRPNIGPNCKYYKRGGHTTGQNTIMYFRSSYELDYAKSLDEQKIKYESESIRIKYGDTVKMKFRFGYPDFYLPDTNTIVEIKGGGTYDEQNLKDRAIAIKALGYKFLLILEKEEIGL